MADGLLPLVGKVVQITVAEGSYLPFAATSSYYGVLEALDDGAVLLLSASGERLYLMRDSIRAVRVIDLPPGEEDMLLRATDNPDEDDLLRPAPHAKVDSATLPRVAEPPETSGR